MYRQKVSCFIDRVGPPAKSTFGQSFLTEPESLAIVNQDLDGCPQPVTKDKYASGKGIRLQYLSTDTCQAIDAFTKVSWLCSHQYPHMRSNLNHFPSIVIELLYQTDCQVPLGQLTNALISSDRSVSGELDRQICISVPSGRFNSIRQDLD